ncbi:hypothetical protein FACS1894184_17000 [Clostridia bacterium]|nr:hypothetical protein FACS1894184_17000 [Clostridia bacterium]
MVKAKELAATALGLLTGPTIPYVNAGTTMAGMDCQGLVKYCAKQSGLTLKFAGSNDMFRNACTEIWTISDAKKKGKLVPGAVCFILERDGNEPDKYKRDGLGNASHIGVVTLGRSAWSVDASNSAGKVRPRDERNAMYVWTHIGHLKGVDYGQQTAALSDAAIAVSPAGLAGSTGSGAATNDGALATALVGGMAVVTADPTVTFRKEPKIIKGVDNRVARCPRIEKGAFVETQRALGEWTNIKYNGMTGWVMSQYLEYVE